MFSLGLDESATEDKRVALVKMRLHILNMLEIFEKKIREWLMDSDAWNRSLVPNLWEERDNRIIFTVVASYIKDNSKFRHDWQIFCRLYWFQDLAWSCTVENIQAIIVYVSKERLLEETLLDFSVRVLKVIESYRRDIQPRDKSQKWDKALIVGKSYRRDIQPRDKSQKLDPVLEQLVINWKWWFESYNEYLLISVIERVWWLMNVSINLLIFLAEKKPEVLMYYIWKSIEKPMGWERVEDIIRCIFRNITIDWKQQHLFGILFISDENRKLFIIKYLLILINKIYDLELFVSFLWELIKWNNCLEIIKVLELSDRKDLLHALMVHKNCIREKIGLSIIESFIVCWYGQQVFESLLDSDSFEQIPADTYTCILKFCGGNIDNTIPSFLEYFISRCNTKENVKILFNLVNWDLIYAFIVFWLWTRVYEEIIVRNWFEGDLLEGEFARRLFLSQIEEDRVLYNRIVRNYIGKPI